MPVPADARSTLLDFQAHKYYKSSLQSEYRRHEGLLVVPIMGPAGSAPAVWRVHAPYAIRESDFEYIKAGSPPVYPAPADTNAGDLLLDSSVVLPSPSWGGDGVPIYGARGKYVYVQPDDGRSARSIIALDQHPYPNPFMMIDQYKFKAASDYEIDKILDGVWNRNYVDNSQFCSYGMLGATE